jgi:hypothetical protein
MSSKPLAQRTIAELLSRAAELDKMAGTATTWSVKGSLERLAERFRAMALRRASESPGQKPLNPAEPAPITGDYRQLNVFGTPTGKTVYVEQGEPLAAAPLGFTWRLVRTT